MRSRSFCPSHEVHHFLKTNRPIVVRIHRLEDFLVSRLPLLQRDSAVAIGIHESKNDPHSDRVHHASMAHHTLTHPAPAHHASTHHTAVIGGALFSLFLPSLRHHRATGRLLSECRYRCTGQECH